MEFLYLILNIWKHIFKRAIIKVVFIGTDLYLFNLKKVLNRLLLLRKATLENDLILDINIAILKTIK